MDRPVYGPVWPPPTQRALTPPAEEDIEMADRPNDRSQDNDDTSSEATLVEGDALPSYSDAVGPKAVSEILTDNKSGLTQDVGTITTAEPEADTAMENSDTLSNGSDKTIPAPEKPPPVPPRNKNGLSVDPNRKETDFQKETSKKESRAWATQQDVTEVIGNVTFRMQCAIMATSFDQEGEQLDVVRETFFGATTVTTEKVQSLERKEEAWSTIIVFPGEGAPRDIYDALDVAYDPQQIEVDGDMVLQYHSISKLPPVLQIQIQRTAFDKAAQTQSKNLTPVTFPETIYLDRYMHTSDPHSALMRRRRQTWDWKTELRTLTTRYDALTQKSANLTVPEALNATKEFISALQAEGVPGVEVSPSLQDALEERISEIASELDSLNSKIKDLKSRIEQQFMDLRENEYKLHAVFMHRGSNTSGHYWIYIYDSIADVWRRYNDTSVDRWDRRKVFDISLQPEFDGTPYYLVYVRSADHSNVVDVVCRDVDLSLPDPNSETQANGKWDGDGPYNVGDGVRVGDSEMVDIGAGGNGMVNGNGSGYYDAPAVNSHSTAGKSRWDNEAVDPDMPPLADQNGLSAVVDRSNW